MAKTRASKVLFSMVVVFVVILTVSFVEARSLKKGEEYKEKSGEAIRVVSSDEVEIERGGDILLGKYTVDGERVRIVTPFLGATVVTYYKITPDGLVEEKGGTIYYSKAAFAEKGKANAKAAFIQAVANGNTELTKTLLAKGADVNAKDSIGRTVLTLASFNGHTEIVKMLLDKGADVNAKDNNTGVTALIPAANQGHTEIVKMLLAKGADINAKNIIIGKTALYFAVEKGHTEIVKMLLEKGADVSIKDSSGKTVFDPQNTGDAQ